MIHEFMDYLFEMANNLQKLLPKEIIDGAKRLAAKLKGQQFSPQLCKERALRNHLDSYRKLSVYGFNSGKSFLQFLILILF